MVFSKSTSEEETDNVNKNLLEFYQNKFDERFKGEDKYKEKLDKHLKEIIADRYELEAEVTRKGEKISSLQKALVEMQMSLLDERSRFLTISAENDRLKKNEELLHNSIRNLLSHTKDRELRDRILYILQDPKVAIHLRHVEGKSTGTPSSATKQKSASDLIKEEIQQLQSKIDEYTRISKNNSDVVLEDCKVALEKSKEKILEDEQEIRKLQKRLQESEREIENLQQSQPNNRSTGLSRNAEQLPRTRTTVPSSSISDEAIHNASDQPPLLTNIEDIKFSLASLIQFLLKIESLLRKIKSSETFASASNQQTSTADTEFVDEKDISELQSYIRKCTRLSYEIKNVWTSAHNEIRKQSMPVRQRDIQQFETVVDDLSVYTAEIEILYLGLGRSKFFEYLITKTITLSDDTGPPDHSKCASDFVALEDKVKSTTVSVKTATDILERISRNIDLVGRLQNKTLPGRQSGDPQLSSSNRGRFQTETQPKQMNAVNRTRSEPIGGGEVIRRIDKTLSKIRQIETGEYARDDALCRHLADQIRALSDQLRDLFKEFDEKSVHDNFNEYSAVTLSKLETLAKQSRDTVIAAEARITAYRSNAQQLSQKLFETQELLRESIKECLDVKRKLAQLEIAKGIEKIKAGEDPRQTFLRTKATKDPDEPTSPENAPQIFHRTINKQTFSRTRIVHDTNDPKSSDSAQSKFFRTIDLDGNETSVKRLISSSKSPRKPEGPYECMFCKQDHKLCVEKIKDLQADIRKLNMQLKDLDKEAKKERNIAQVHKDAAEKASFDLEMEKQNNRETIAGLEAKNASLLEQLKILKNRCKHMERFRRLEIEGFQTDIKNLKTKIKDLEKQLSKAVCIFEQKQNDLEMLKTIHETAKQSKSSVSAIKRLKAKLYEIETDIKRI